MQSPNFFNKSVSCIHCGKFLGWSNIEYDPICDNCRVHDYKMKRIPRTIAQMKRAHSGIKESE